MKKLFLCLSICLLYVQFNANAQTLEEELNLISITNDMMGGSVVVFCENGILESKAFGKADLSRDLDMTEDSKYRVASISKTITAIAVMQLVEQGLLDVDQDISSILGYDVRNPNFPDQPISVRNLLSHKSSIIDGPTYSNFLGATVNDTPIPNLSEILTANGAYYNTDQFNNILPGTYFNYSNINYVILGTIVEKVSNLRFDVYCKQNISDRLGIDASFNVNDIADINQLAVLYRKPDGIWTPQRDNYQGVQPVFTNLESYVPGTNGGRFGPQGGFRCSAKDLAKVFLVLMNQGTFDGMTLLSPESCEMMLANEWTYDGSNGNNYFGLFLSWGLGIHRIVSQPGGDIAFQDSEQMFGHSGLAYGLVSDAYFDPEKKVGFVFMTNGVGVGFQTNNQSIFYTVEQEVFAAVENYGNIEECLQPTNTKDIGLSNTSLYPNPGYTFIYLPEGEMVNDGRIKIYDLMGGQVQESYLKKGETRIDIDALTSGMYILVVNDRKYSFVKK